MLLRDVLDAAASRVFRLCFAMCVDMIPDWLVSICDLRVSFEVPGSRRDDPVESVVHRE